MILYLYCWLFKKFGKKNLESYLRFFSFIPNINRGGCYLVACILKRHFGGTVVYILDNQYYNFFKDRLKQGKIIGANHVYCKIGKNYIDSTGVYEYDEIVQSQWGHITKKLTKKYVSALTREDNHVFWNDAFSHKNKQTLKKFFL